MPGNPTLETAKEYVMAYFYRPLALLNHNELYDRFGLEIREDRITPLYHQTAYITVRFVYAMRKLINVDEVVAFFKLRFGARYVQISLRHDQILHHDSRLGIDFTQVVGPSMLDIYFVYGQPFQTPISDEDWKVAAARAYTGGMLVT